MPNNEQIFHINVFGMFGLLSIAIFSPALWLLSDSFFGLVVGVVFFLVAEFATYLLCTVAVGGDGIILYRKNEARWKDIAAARRVSFFGLPYLKIERVEGISWLLPLYLTDFEEFRLTVAQNAPIGNPVREYAESIA